MNIPLNGRIAIVDDKYAEVKPLMDIFSKNRIPFNYYTGLKNADLPTNSNENPISLLFLDLNIVETQHNPKVVISTLHPILKSLCPSTPVPYFLIIWSKKINDFADQLEKHFRQNIDVKSKRPVKIIRLNKTDYFDYINGKYRFNDEKYELLINTLKTELDNISLLKNLLIWENIVHHKTKDTVSEFSSFYEIDSNWDKNTKAIIFHLAKSIIGNDDIQSKSDESKLLTAFGSINSFLASKIESAIETEKLGEINEIVDAHYDFKKRKDGLNNIIKAKLNSKLHLMTKSFTINDFEQGNIYKIANENNLLKRILWKERYQNTLSKEILKSNPSLVQLDLTPVCDYSQDKRYVRMIYGLLINAKYYTEITKCDYIIKTPILRIGNKEKFMLFDFRFIKSTAKDEIIKRKITPIFKLRREICTEIQSQLSNQINRPGISNV